MATAKLQAVLIVSCLALSLTFVMSQKPPRGKPPVPGAKNCCYSYKNIRVCVNPVKPVGQCQKICNITVCCTGPGLIGAPAPALPPATSSYIPVLPSPDKCCFCYGGIRFCLGRQPKTSVFAYCARNVCNKYNICFSKDRC